MVEIGATDARPLYPHACDACTYLGMFRGSDLYFCHQPTVGLDTVIARYGPGLQDYRSGILVAPYDQELVEAVRRARDRKLMTFT